MLTLHRPGSGPWHRLPAGRKSVLLMMLVLGLCIVIGLLGGGAAFVWLHQAEPGIALLLGTWGSIPFTLAALLGTIALRGKSADGR